MKQNLTQHTIIFFVNIKNWNILLKKIRSFLALYKRQITTYEINFTYLDQDSVRISFLINNIQYSSFKKTVNLHFKDFFNTPTFSYSDPHYYITQLDIYQYNSIFDVKQELKKELCDTILAVLSKEKLDQYSIITFAYYVHLILLKVFKTNFSTPIKILLDNYQIDFSFQYVDLKNIHYNCRNNYNTLYSITEKILKKENSFDENLADLNILYEAYQKFIKNHECLINESSTELYKNRKKLHSDMLQIIDLNLGIYDFYKNLLSYFIYQITTLNINKNHPKNLPDLRKIKAEMKKKHILKVNETPLFYTRIDKLLIPKDSNELRLFVIARNESLRLPYFLKYYSDLGVERFFLIDNNSTDNTCEIALSFKNVHIFKIDKSYKEHWNWIEYFLNKFGKKKWCLVVDIDELLYYPYSENISLQQLIKYLENNNYTALKSFLIDVHSDKPIIDTIYYPGTNPLDICQFFDPTIYKLKGLFFDKKKWTYFISETFHGGAREIKFANLNTKFSDLTKHSLFKYEEKTYLTQGMHGINGANVADIQGAVMHTKFMSDFKERVKEESEREEHFNNAAEYKIYNNLIEKDNLLILKNNASIKFRNTQQLIKLELMKCSNEYMNFIQSFVLKDI